MPMIYFAVFEPGIWIGATASENKDLNAIFVIPAQPKPYGGKRSWVQQLATQLNEHVLQFLSKPKKMLIDGKWVDATSGKTFATLDPSTEEALVQVAEGDKQDVDLAVKAARRAFENGPWRKMTPSERGRAIWKLADLMEQNLEQFAELETLDNGKPIGVGRAADVPLSVDLFRYIAVWATKVEATTIPISLPVTPVAKDFSYTLRKPVGVVAQIIPWNFPLLMAAWKLGPALATCWP